jgi:hypothetical protein
MKKLVIVLALFLMANSFLFSSDVIWSENWLGIGANFGNYFQNDSDLGNFYAGSSGINFSAYAFPNHKKNIGLFINFGLLFPVLNTIEDNYDLVTKSEYIFGPVFRHNINEKIKLYYGIGINFYFSYFLNDVNDNIKYSDYRTGFGIGGDVGFKYDITDIVYINIGTTLVYNFVSARTAESTTDNWTNTRLDFNGWSNNFSMFGIRPYIAIGLNSYYEHVRTRWGKPIITE